MNPTTMPPEVAEAARVLAEWKAANKPPKARKRNTRPKMVTDEQATAIFDAMPNRGYTPRRNRAILALLEATGLRIGEALALGVDDVEYIEAEGIYRVTVPDTAGCKSGFRVVFAPAMMNGHPTRLHKAMTWWRKERVGDSPYLYNTWNDTQVARQSVTRALSHYQEKAGVSGVSLHMYRHAYATRQSRAGIEPDAVRAMLGHSDLSTTAIYLTTDENRLREIAKAQTGMPQSGNDERGL